MVSLFLTVLGLHYFMWIFSSCGKWRGGGGVGALLLRCSVWASHCGGFSCCGPRALECTVSVVVVHGLSCPQHVEFSWSRD